MRVKTMFGEKRAKEIVQDVLQRCAPQPSEVLLMAEEKALTRFANNYIHQNVAETNVEMIVRLVAGRDQIGSATTNILEPEALDEVVERAKANAQASPSDPDFNGLAKPATYDRVGSYDEKTMEYPPQKRAEAVGVVCRLATEKGLNASGSFSTGGGELVVANSEGVFAYYPQTQADFQTVVMADDASGYAQRSHWRVNTLDVENLGREAIHKAIRGRKPRNIESGEYPVVLDAYATADILEMLSWYGMGALSVFEGRSWMNDRMGEQAMSPLVNICDDGLDDRGIPMPFDFEGVPKQRVDIVRAGIVQGPVYDRYIGGKMGKESTGHALPPTARPLSPLPMNLFMQPGETPTEGLINSTERGLYITRFHYTRLVHPRDCVITGMTRDGVFWIEKSELAYPVKNLRFTQGYVKALADVETLGSETRLLTSEYLPGSMFVPALKLKIFHFTGLTA
ncbi:MAG: TldD/PmbA family protein [Chloroflexota bacterium]